MNPSNIKVNLNSIYIADNSEKNSTNKQEKAQARVSEVKKRSLADLGNSPSSDQTKAMISNIQPNTASGVHPRIGAAALHMPQNIHAANLESSIHEPSFTVNATTFATETRKIEELERDTIQIFKDFAEVTSVQAAIQIRKYKILPFLNDLKSKIQSPQVKELISLLDQLADYQYENYLKDGASSWLFSNFESFELYSLKQRNLYSINLYRSGKGWNSLKDYHYDGLRKIYNILLDTKKKSQFDFIVKAINLEGIKYQYYATQGTREFMTIQLGPSLLYFLQNEFMLMNPDEISDFLDKKLTFNFFGPICKRSVIELKSKVNFSGLYLALLSHNHEKLLGQIGEKRLLAHKEEINAILANFKVNGLEEYVPPIIASLKKQCKKTNIFEGSHANQHYFVSYEMLKTKNINDLILIHYKKVFNFISTIHALYRELQKCGYVKEAKEVENSAPLDYTMRQIDYEVEKVFSSLNNAANSKIQILNGIQDIKKNLSNNPIFDGLRNYLNNFILYFDTLKNSEATSVNTLKDYASVRIPINALLNFSDYLKRYANIENLKVKELIDQNTTHSQSLLTDSRKIIADALSRQAKVWQRKGYDIHPVIEVLRQMGMDGLDMELANVPFKLETYPFPDKPFDLNETQIAGLKSKIDANIFPLTMEFYYKFKIASYYNRFQKYSTIYKNEDYFEKGAKITEDEFRDLYLQIIPPDNQWLFGPFAAFSTDDVALLEYRFGRGNRSFFTHTLLLFSLLYGFKENVTISHKRLLLTYLKMVKAELAKDNIHFSEWLNAKFSAIFDNLQVINPPLKEKMYSWFDLINKFKDRLNETYAYRRNDYYSQLFDAFLEQESKPAASVDHEARLLEKLLGGYPSPFVDSESPQKTIVNKIDLTLDAIDLTIEDQPLVGEKLSDQTGSNHSSVIPDTSFSNSMPDIDDSILDGKARELEQAEPVLPSIPVQSYEGMETSSSKKIELHQTDRDPALESFAAEVERELSESIVRDIDDIPQMDEMAAFEKEIENELIASSSAEALDDSEEAASSPSLKDPSKKIEHGYIHIAGKYLEVDEPSLPKPSANMETVYEDISQKIKYTLTAPQKESIPPTLIYPLTIKTGDNLFRGTYLTLDQSLDFAKPSRFTFIRAGRQLGALTPAEKGDGRIVLVVTPDEANVMEKCLSKNCDMLVMQAFPGMGIQENDDRLKLPSLRLLAAVAFACHKGLKDMVVMDDNVKNICSLDELLPSNCAWQHVYECFKNSAAQGDYACLSPQTYRPERQSLTLNEIKIKQDVLSYKFYYLNIDKLKAAFQDLKYLIPQNLALWGEDIFFQIHLQIAQLSVGAIHRESLVIVRSRKNKNSCKDIVAKGEDWLRPACKTGLDKAPANYRLAVKEMQQIVKKNLAEIHRRKVKASRLDLPQLTHELYTSSSKAKGAKNIEPSIAKAGKRRGKVELSFPGTVVKTTDDFRLSLVKSVENILARGEAEPALLRSVQKKALEKLKEFFENRGSTRQGYFDIATGVGKSLLFLLLSMEVSKQMTNLSKQKKDESKRHILIIVPEIQLSAQTYEGFSKLAEQVGFDYSSRCIIVNSRAIPRKLFEKNNHFKEAKENIVIMCSKSASLYFGHSPEDLNLFGLTIVDEFHSEKKYLLDLFCQYSRQSGSYLLGFSATPTVDRIPYLGEKLYEYGSHQGVKDGYLAPWIIDTIDGDYNEINYRHLMDDMPEILKNREHPHGGLLTENQGIIFLPSIKDTGEVKAKLKEQGIRSKIIHSKVAASKRMERLRKFKKGDAKLLLAVDMLRKGADLPIDYMCIPRDLTKLEDFVQTRGRGLRATRAGKLAYLIIFNNLLDKVKISKEEAYYYDEDMAKKVSPKYLQQNSQYKSVTINQQLTSDSCAAGKRPAEEDLSSSPKKARVTACTDKAEDTAAGLYRKEERSSAESALFS